ncbi:hypothetical protein NDU88_001214 [Pleurodeles waltl]|uniref:Uncharacterized protein n=1 Tax=Pleurodeles waltl TaxID=8319 RepID=A0AAV7R6I6_PLEWA|nr:hypothetical protein NDU88_001214 [Pleurodeles waltl]
MKKEAGGLQRNTMLQDLAGGFKPLGRREAVLESATTPLWQGLPRVVVRGCRRLAAVMSSVTWEAGGLRDDEGSKRASKDSVLWYLTGNFKPQGWRERRVLAPPPVAKAPGGCGEGLQEAGSDNVLWVLDAGGLSDKESGGRTSKESHALGPR